MSRPRSTSRRRVLAALGVSATATTAGCFGSSRLGGQPAYEDGTVSEINTSNVSNRSPSEMATAASLAQQQPSDSVTPLGTLSLRSHEFVLENGYLGSTIQGTVANTGTERVQTVEVRTRVYDDDGTMLGYYLASTGDLNAGTTWQFQVIVLESPTAVASYDIAVLGTPS